MAVQNLTIVVDDAEILYLSFDLPTFDSVGSFAADFIGNHCRLD
jgi:hypothetical protein